MKHWIPIAVVSMLVATAGGSIWDVSLDMNLNPWADDPAWTATMNLDPEYYGTRISDPEASAGYYREIDTLADAGEVMYYALTGPTFTPDFDAGFTLETNVRWYNGTIPGSHSLVVHSDGEGWLAIQPYYRYASAAWHVGIRVYTNDVGGHALIDLMDIYTPQQGEDGWLPTSWIKLTTIIEDGVAEIYADDTLRLTVDMDNLTTENTYVRFGDQSTGAAGKVDYDYVRLAYYAIPEPGVAGLLLLSAALILFRKRR